MPAPKKFIIAAVLFTFYFLLFAVPVYAQSASDSANQQLSYTQVQTPVPTDLLVANIFHTFSCLAVGSSIINQQCLSYQLSADIHGTVSTIPILSSVNMSGGLIGVGANLLAGMYLTPPLATGDYLASVSEGSGLVKEAHAQVGGSGASVLNPVLRLWQVSRNVSYIVMIVIFLVVGFMVMFRQRINPQTVITAQAALPGLVIGLILITFSYFLAAFITDAAFLGTGLVGYYFSAAQGATFNDLLKNSSNENVLTIMSRFIGATGPDNFAGGITTVLDNITGFARIVIGTVITLIAYQYGSQIGGPIGGIGLAAWCAPGAVVGAAATAGASLGLIPVCAAIGQIVGSATVGGALALFSIVSPAGIVSAALYVLLLAILLYTMFRLIFRLVNNYLSILFLTITAPFHFLAASLPGRQSIATDWVRNMLCNVLAFPAVFAVFYFVAFLLGDRSGPAASSTLFNITSPLTLTGGGALPLLGGLDLSFIRFLLAFGALMATPSIPDILCRTIGKPGAAGQMLEQEISKAQAGGQRYMGQAGQATGAIGKDVERAQQLRDQWEPMLDQQGNLTWRVTPGLPMKGQLVQQHPPLPHPFGPGPGAPGAGGPVGGGPGGAPGPGGPAGGGAPCLPGNTLISTPSGNLPISCLYIGQLIYTLNSSNNRIIAAIKNINKIRISSNHKMIVISLEDGRKVTGSLGHPTADGRTFGQISKGDILDNSRVNKVKVIGYNKKHTYDILPEGVTGYYWANGVITGSTLFNPKKIRNSSLSSQIFL